MYSPFKKILLIIFLCNPQIILSADLNSLEKQFEPIDVEITTHLGDAQTFVEGDQISFMMSLNKDAFVYLFYQDVNGQVLQLVPNSAQSSNFYQAGLFIPVPGQRAKFKFTVQPPFGEDRLWVFVLDTAIQKLPGEQLINGLKLIELSIPQIKSKIKSQALVQYGEHYLSIFTMAAR